MISRTGGLTTGMKESVDFKALSAPSDSLASKHPIDSSEADKYKITG